MYKSKKLAKTNNIHQIQPVGYKISEVDKYLTLRWFKNHVQGVSKFHFKLGMKVQKIVNIDNNIDYKRLKPYN